VEDVAAGDARVRLISLEVHGFKSFADPQKLTFPQGMTAVVGPNGCGKSNISDALAWVLGEQRATLLRGAEMADVIFAGTGQRKPMGLAEVKLTLEMPDAALPGATREVTVSRRLYRDTGSDYRINGRECRLKDVQDLLMDTGMGTRAYSFIQQGQIDLILSSKPKDRRSLLEEAAGITRYKVRRADAERRLADTRANLLRLDDILFELGKQQDALKRQAAKARRAQELDEAIRSTQRILLAGKALELEAAKEAIAETLDGLERRIATLTAQVSEQGSEVENQHLALDELTRQQDRRARGLLALDQKSGLLEQDLGFQRERGGDARSQGAQLEQRLAELAGRAGESEAELAGLQAAAEAAGTALEARESLVAGAEEAAALAGGALRRVEGELKALRARRAEAEKEALAASRRRQALHQEIAQRTGRLEALNQDEAVRAPRLESLRADQARLGREEEGAADRLEQMEEAVAVQGRIRDEAMAAHRASGAALGEAEGALEAEERRLRQIGDLLRAAVGSEEQRKALAWLRQRGEDPLAVADALTLADPDLPALERLLGAWAQTVALGPAGLAALAEAPGQLWAAAEAPAGDAAPPAPGAGCVPLRDRIRWRPGRPRPLAGLLDRAFLCADADLPALGAGRPDLAFVSPRLVKLPFGPVQVGATAPAASPFKLRAEQEASRQARERHLERVETLEAEQKALAGKAEEAGVRFREMEEDHLTARRALQDLRGRKASVAAQLREIQEAQERADAQWEVLEGEIAGLKAQLRDLEVPEDSPEEAGLAAEIQAGEARREEAQRFLEEKREILVEASRARSSAWAERDALQRHLQQLQRAGFDLAAERERVQGEIAQARERAEQAEARGAELEREIQDLLRDRAALQDQQAAALPGIGQAQERLRVQERAVRDLQEALENARQLHQEAKLQGAQVQGSLAATGREVELALALTIPELLASVTGEERQAWVQGELVHQTRLTELHGKRLDLGSVNPLAIQELKEAEERLAFMNQQRKDVLEAIANLEATIREINAISEDRFREAFDFINKRFQEVFREAFGGGSATLVLQDPKDLLECGIEITAQPPGKSAKALTLLSGGEKALTAISLLFAIFHFKPSPFCVLDEVDAPLDEANVGRFAHMVQTMKDGTQFIVITHQKPTMTAADTLYGVTMAELGVSRLVSVQLREAAQLV
jgi:chromosome segregation protein